LTPGRDIQHNFVVRSRGSQQGKGFRNSLIAPFEGVQYILLQYPRNCLLRDGVATVSESTS